MLIRSWKSILCCLSLPANRVCIASDIVACARESSRLLTALHVWWLRAPSSSFAPVRLPLLLSASWYSGELGATFIPHQIFLLNHKPCMFLQSRMVNLFNNSHPPNDSNAQENVFSKTLAQCVSNQRFEEFLAAGCQLLAACCWLLAAACWLLAACCRLLLAGSWLLGAGCLLPAAVCWQLSAGCLLLNLRLQRIRSFDFDS